MQLCCYCVRQHHTRTKVSARSKSMVDPRLEQNFHYMQDPSITILCMLRIKNSSNFVRGSKVVGIPVEGHDKCPVASHHRISPVTFIYILNLWLGLSGKYYFTYPSLIVLTRMMYESIGLPFVLTILKHPYWYSLAINFIYLKKLRFRLDFWVRNQRISICQT